MILTVDCELYQEGKDIDFDFEFCFAEGTDM